MSIVRLIASQIMALHEQLLTPPKPNSTASGLGVQPLGPSPPQANGRGASPKQPLELILQWLWERRWGRVVVTLLGCLAVLAFVAQSVSVLTNLYNQFAPREHAKPSVPVYVRDGYYVEDHQKIFDLGPWRDVSPSERNEKVSLAICYGYFTINREKEEAKNFIHRISSTANVEPEVFGNRTFEKLPVEGFDKVGGLRIWEIRFDISNEPLHQPIPVRFVIFFWNNFNRKDQWDAGIRVYNRTDHSLLEVRFPRWKPVKKVEFETRPPTGEKAKAIPCTPNPDLVHYQRDTEGNILSVVWQLEGPTEDKTYWITWDWS
jgi:hypothetical protein